MLNSEFEDLILHLVMAVILNSECLANLYKSIYWHCSHISCKSFFWQEQTAQQSQHQTCCFYVLVIPPCKIEQIDSMLKSSVMVQGSNPRLIKIFQLFNWVKHWSKDYHRKHRSGSPNLAALGEQPMTRCSTDNKWMAGLNFYYEQWRSYLKWEISRPSQYWWIINYLQWKQPPAACR